MNLDGLTLGVSSTGAQGVVDADTRLRFTQREDRVLGRYSGGAVSRGYLVGRVRGMKLVFRYAQLEKSGELTAGRSDCELILQATGRIRMIERFSWRTRTGSGTNVFDEVDGAAI